MSTTSRCTDRFERPEETRQRPGHAQADAHEEPPARSPVCPARRADRCGVQRTRQAVPVRGFPRPRVPRACRRRACVASRNASSLWCWLRRPAQTPAWLGRAATNGMFARHGRFRAGLQETVAVQAAEHAAVNAGGDLLRVDLCRSTAKNRQKLLAMPQALPKLRAALSET